MGRPREQETARPAPAIDGDLDGEEQIRRSLHLVDDGQLVEGSEEARGIPLGGRQGGGLVQGDVAVRRNERLGERGLPAWRGPTRRTTGVSRSAAVIVSVICRSNMGVYTLDG